VRQGLHHNNLHDHNHNHYHDRSTVYHIYLDYHIYNHDYYHHNHNHYHDRSTVYHIYLDYHIYNHDYYHHRRPDDNQPQRQAADSAAAGKSRGAGEAGRPDNGRSEEIG